MGLFSFLFGQKQTIDFKELLAKGAVVVDVRTPSEFASGNYQGSINISLDKIQKNVQEVKRKGKPIITVCRSGSRSGIAKKILQASAVECYNGGSWEDFKQKVSN